ncbi:MAG: U32 family peptidase [Clostridia bacterium]
MIELLSPAGNMEKLKTAFYFGADAVYFAGKKYGLRAFSENFKQDELKTSIDYAHSLNKKAYITLNIIAHNEDFDGLKEYVQYLESIGADAVIIADLGILEFVKKYAPKLAIHISTQTSMTNKYAVKAMADMGAKRIVLARELTMPEILEIKNYVGDSVELEAFVHGAMCISYSGRCLLSNYFTGRDSNRGACVQACRWQYTISEVSRQNEQFPIMEDQRGTYILNSKDLNMIKYIDKLAEAGVQSFKIEGRMKSPYYVATITNAYRHAIDFYAKHKNNYIVPEELETDLKKTSHRKYTTGFYFNADDKEYLNSATPVQTHEFMAVVLNNTDKQGYTLIEQRNRFKVGETLEILSPDKNFNKTFVVEDMKNLENEPITDALLVKQQILIKTPYKLHENDILRKIIVPLE